MWPISEFIGSLKLGSGAAAQPSGFGVPIGDLSCHCHVHDCQLAKSERHSVCKVVQEMNQKPLGVDPIQRLSYLLDDYEITAASVAPL